MAEETKQSKDKKTQQPKEGAKKEEAKKVEVGKEKVRKEEILLPEAKQGPEVKKPEVAKPAVKPRKEIKVSDKLKKIIEEIEKLTVLELSDLVKALEEKFGVAAPLAPAIATQPETKSKEAGTAAPEQTIFNVILAQTGPNKIQVIKALREIKPTLGLQETKKITEETPQEILTQVNKKEAEEAKKKLEAVGAKVELK